MSSEIYRPISSRKWYALGTSSDGSEATAYLYDDIGGNGITAKDFIEDMGYIKADKLNVRINSYGGEIDQGVAIYNYLIQRGGQVVVHIDGIAASIASVIAMAGDQVVMGKAAMMFIHNPWTMVAGDSASLEKEARDLAKRKDALIEIYKAKAGLDESFLSNMMDDETLLDAEEAVALGFADSIYSEEEESMALNCAMHNRVVRAMAKKMKGEAMDEKTEEIKDQPVDEAVVAVDSADVSDQELSEQEAAQQEETVEADAEPVEDAQPVEEEAVDAPVDDAQPVEVEEPVAENKEQIDARAEFKKFVDAFGADRAGVYYADGLDFGAAQARYVGEIKAENEDLKKRLKASDSVKPVDSMPRDEVAEPMFTREQIAKMSAEEYRMNRDKINKAQAEGRIK